MLKKYSAALWAALQEYGKKTLARPSLVDTGGLFTDGYLYEPAR